MTIKTLLIWVALLASGVVTAADTADSVLACMRANVPTSLRAQDVEFSTTYKNGTSNTLKGRLYMTSELNAQGQRHLRSVLYMMAPPNLSGAAYLVREKDGDSRDGMYVYLPSVKRVRRVTGSIADGGMLGTSFSYGDFKQIQNTFGDVQQTLEGAAEIDQRAVHVLAFKPREAAQGGYTLVRAWVDQQTCVPIKLEFHQDSKLIKRLTTPTNALQQYEQRWYGSVIEMRDFSDDTLTVLRIKGAALDKDLPGALFDPRSFYQR